MRRSNYRVLGLVGQGQFGQVFCALHRPTGQLVALKNLEHDRFPTHKFLRELRFLLSLQHPNIVTCRALEHTATGRYLVMDYCEGGTLRSLMPEESRLSLPAVIGLIEDLLLGLEHAHSRQIVHCDIKPENILVQLSPGGWMARISDFGIARLSQEIQVQEGATGSPAYMAPERFYGQYSAASDLYSVGILLFELITGYRPFSGTPAELMSAHLNAPLQFPDSLPLVWRPVIAKALQKLPGRRFHSAAEMLEAVRLARAKQPQVHPSPLFFTIIAPPYCRFKPATQRLLAQEIYRLAAGQAHLWQAASQQIAGWTEQAIAESGISPQLVSADQISAPVEQFLIRSQGCFIATSRSLALASAPDWTDGIQQISTWDHDRTVTIDPQGRWLALLEQDAPSQLIVQRLPAFGDQAGDQAFERATSRLTVSSTSLPVSVTGGKLITMLALESRHLALFWDRSQSGSKGTAVELLNRRGNRLGELALPLRLRQVSLTPKPYRLLATDDCPGTVLLLDLKPYRIRRIWVEIVPVLLLAADWGYILAAADGTMIFLDQAGLQIGRLNGPSQITALAIWRNRLWLSTWDQAQGQLYGLDLPSLGLDLVF